jgi:hypothetical protein
MIRLTGRDPTVCPVCGRGHLRQIEELPAVRYGSPGRSPPWGCRSFSLTSVLCFASERGLEGVCPSRICGTMAETKPLPEGLLVVEPLAMTPDMIFRSQLRELEESHLRSDVRSSQESMRALLADEFIEFGSSGRIFDRAAVIAALSGEPGFKSRIDDFVVRSLSSEVALTTYRLSAWYTSEGQARVTLRSSIWVQRAGRWLMVFHQGTLAGEGVA